MILRVCHLPKPTSALANWGFYFDTCLAAPIEQNWSRGFQSFFSFKKKKSLKYVCVWGESQSCWILELGIGVKGGPGSCIPLQPAGLVLLLISASRACSGLLVLPANHWQTLALEAWTDECFACWNKRSSEIWPDPVKSHEITWFQPGIH